MMVKGYVRMAAWLGVVACVAASVEGAELSERIREILNGKEAAKADFSLLLVDLASGETIYAHNADLPLKPASNMKLVTTGAALAVLGPEFAYETVIGLQGQDLVVVGAGDPLTGDPRLAEARGEGIDAIFAKVHEALAGRGMKEIAGDLVIDDFVFDDERYHPSWPVEQANKWYAAQVSALCFNDNCIDVTVRPGAAAGAKAGWSIVPATQYVKVENECATVGAGPNGAWAARVLGENELTLKGKVRTEHTFNVTVERPSAFFGHLLAEYLLGKGVAIKGKLYVRRVRGEKGELPEGLESLVVWRTELGEVLRRANEDSLNLAAECLFKTVGARWGLEEGWTCQQGSWGRGRAAVESYLTGLGLEEGQFKIDDGCGLSHENRLTARCLTTVVRAAANGPGGAMFRESLAAPGEGTLGRAGRLREGVFAGKVLAKTGYVRGAWGLSGLCQLADGRWAAFSLLANGSTGSQAGTLDRILGQMVGE